MSEKQSRREEHDQRPKGFTAAETDESRSCGRRARAGLKLCDQLSGLCLLLLEAVQLRVFTFNTELIMFLQARC